MASDGVTSASSEIKQLSETLTVISKSIFLNNVDEYQMNAIANHLLKEDSVSEEIKLFGSLYQQNGNVTPKSFAREKTTESENFENIAECSVIGSKNSSSTTTREILERIEILDQNRQDYVEKIIECDVIVYDIGSYDTKQVFSDIPNVLHSLEVWALLQRTVAETTNDDFKNIRGKFFILISTPLTWAQTNSHGVMSSSLTSSSSSVTSESHVLVDSNYRKRIPHRYYQNHKTIEQQVMWLQPKCLPFVRTLVVCPGITYGGANDKLRFIFRNAFYNKQIPVFTPGTQYVPFIYLNDFARIITSIIVKFPEPKKRYIFAVQPNKMTLMDFAKSIAMSFIGSHSKCKRISIEEMLCLDMELFPQSLYDALCLNLKIASTNYLKKFSYESSNKEDFWDVVAQEFRDAHNIRPLKILIESQFRIAVEKSERLQIVELAKRIADHYRLIFLDVTAVVRDWETLKWPLFDSNDQFNHEIGQLASFESYDWMKSFRQLFLDIWVADEDCDNTDNNLRYETIEGFFAKLLQSKSFNDNQGYLFCGIPFDNSQVEHIFENRIPTHFIQIVTDDEFKKQNEIKLLEIEPTNYFTSSKTIHLLFDDICKDLGSGYAYPRDPDEELQRIERAKLAEIKKQKKREELKSKVAEEHKLKVRKWTQRHEQILRAQDQMAEIKSLPLREYLKKYVLPILTDGILKVAEQKPENPIDFLAEYLVKENPHGMRVPSRCTTKQRTRFHRSVFR